jgi:hypothetical protein
MYKNEFKNDPHLLLQNIYYKDSLNLILWADKKDNFFNFYMPKQVQNPCLRSRKLFHHRKHLQNTANKR